MKEAVYKGHGQIESYPLNSALWGVISHEQRHANFNKYIASINNEKVEQHINISIQFKDGQPVATNAYTKAEFKKENVKSEENILKLLFLNFKISRLKEKLNKAGNDEKDKIYLEIFNLEKQLKKIKSEIFNGFNLYKALKNKKEYAKFYGIYDFEKFNIPPVIIHNPLSAGYLIDKYLKNEYSKFQASEHKKILDVKLTENNYILHLKNVYENIYTKFKAFQSYLEDFSINYFSVSNDNSSYFTVEMANPDKVTEGDYNIKIDNLARSLVVYSKEFDDVYEDLNISGKFYLNGIEVDVETTDSLYDIVEKINWGEDANHNDVLDYDEDEDTNNNEKLDGGTREHGIYAYIENNKLYLKNVETGNIKIIINDEDNILHNFDILRENPVNDSSYFPHILQEGIDATYYINNEKFTSHSNVINYKGLTISLEHQTNNVKSFKVEKDFDKLYNEIENFAANYNYMVKSLNDILMDENIQDYFAIKLIKRGLKIALFSDVNNKDVGDIGFSLKDKKNYLEELEVLTQKGDKIFNNSIYEKLFSIGIVTNADETISIDKDKLLQHYEDVKKIFSGENGVINRLKTFVKQVTDDNGILAFQLSALTSEDITQIKKFYNSAKISYDYISKKLENISEIIK